MTEPTSIEQIMETLERNHIWVNRMMLIKPTDKFAQSLGYQLIEMLNYQTLLPQYVAPGDRNAAMLKFSELTKTLYLRVNAS